MSQPLPAGFSPTVLDAARALFPHVAQGKIYLNHAGTSPLSTRVVDALTGYLRRRSEGMLDTYEQDCVMVDECRADIARLINAESPERVAFQASTSDAINVLASGLPWHSGDRILVGAQEFPANVYPYLNLRNRGVLLDHLEAPDGMLTPGLIEARITPRTRLLALSAVQYLSGFRADLRAIGDLCRSRGVVFAVDGIQAIGGVRIDVRRDNVDFLAAGAQKWQMGPHGTGFLYLTEELQSRIQQTSLGWLATEDPWKFYDYDQPLAGSARRYEGGSLNMPGLWGLHAAIRTILEFVPERIESHLHAINAVLIDCLRNVDGCRIITPTALPERAGIVSIALRAGINAGSVMEYLGEHNITIAVREGKLRFSPHFYVTAEEMRHVADLTAGFLRRSG